MIFLPARLIQLPFLSEIWTFSAPGTNIIDMDPLISGIIEAEKVRFAESEIRLKKRIAEALDEARRLTAVFQKIDPNLGRVILFGSLAEGTVSSENFDIDLAVESKEYLRLVSLGLDSDFKVDVVELAALPESYKERIMKKGVVLYESHKS